jgi:hypothetical protein
MTTVMSKRVRTEPPNFYRRRYRKFDWQYHDTRIQQQAQRLMEQVCELLQGCGETVNCDIEVTVNDGLVTLRGTVERRKVKRLAENIARSIAGVRRVSNQITLAALPLPRSTGVLQPRQFTSASEKS